MVGQVFVLYGRPVNTDGTLGATYVAGVFVDRDAAETYRRSLPGSWMVVGRTLVEDGEDG
jgi:hypothetical protein